MAAEAACLAAQSSSAVSLEEGGEHIAAAFGHKVVNVGADKIYAI